ncbi:MAG: ImmA/IrrE family metallo-endopeptidase [Mesorhizobium sp.]|uniref:ImmA/IrrE family metallo-endopeptidase n=1 Tax=Mesorhizobium sp. TaxID=1871066 RepID=UPI000FE94F37|nr:ImmA/IrrE family metallo-endopeptidase [Mesorhizobium sp.]RWM02076.1 MAG: ImmA/IrrE family metallo-endopeptidase [Mesorhizobium sp.]
MSGQNYVVPPWSWADIGRLTDGLRVQFSLADKPEFPVMEFLEIVLDQRLGAVRMEIESEEDMGDYEGLTDPNGDFIALREDVYAKAWAGDGRARFTVAHEIGHLFLHTGRPMARASSRANIPKFRLSEPQANQFAAELLMPRRFMNQLDAVHTVALRHGVSIEAARNRILYMKESVWKAA